MNIFKEIKSEHEDFRKVADKIDETTDRAEKTRNEQFAKLKRDIKTHHESEEVVLVPVLKDHKETKDYGLEIVEEHHVLDGLMDELTDLDVTDEKWGVKFGVFKEILEHHLEDEETKIADEAEKIIDKDKLKELGDEFEKEREIQKEKYDKEKNLD